jgi:DNA polymerase III delta prime subunit
LSILKPKYLSRERPPTILIKNKELDLHLRLILEDYLYQMLTKVKDAQKDAALWLYPFLKLLETMIHTLLEKAISKQLDQLGEFEYRLQHMSEQESTQIGKAEQKWLRPEEARLEHAFRMTGKLP